MPLFSKLRSKSAQNTKAKAQPEPGSGVVAPPPKPRFVSTWTSSEIVPSEVEELVEVCTAEMKLRGMTEMMFACIAKLTCPLAEALSSPFLLLPFRLDSDSSSARSFIGGYFKGNASGSHQYRGAALRQEIRLTEPSVICSILKWCWSRMPGGVVSWPVYEAFKIGEQESRMARDAFNTFVPIGADSSARKNVILNFFDLLAAVAAHGKSNGLAGRKLSRLAGWWAFELSDGGKGFEGGYKSWTQAADAASHLFFAYLRSLSPDTNPSLNVIERIPRSLQALLAQTEYPPETPVLLQRATPRVVMIVDTVSPTPFALLRRARKFEYRENDRVLNQFAEFEDPVNALTDECKRVLYAIANINSHAAVRSRQGQYSNPDETWSAFSNLGFSDMSSAASPNGMNGSAKPTTAQSGLSSAPRSRQADFGRPTTPSWADFLSSGFADDDTKAPPTLLLPPDKVLPPIGSRAQTPANGRMGTSNGDEDLAPGELAAVTNVDLDDAFWWVWMTSLAGEEPNERKAVFGRCALVETTIRGNWLIMEEQVKGASPDPMEGAQIVEKKSRFGFTKRGRLGGRKATDKKQSPAPAPALDRTISATPSKTSVGPEQHAKIRAAAAALARKESGQPDETAQRRGRVEDSASMKTNSVLTLGLTSEAGPAMQWAKSYDKHALRAQYLGDNFAGKGASREDLARVASSASNADARSAAPSVAPAPALSPDASSFPKTSTDRDLPALPSQAEPTPAEPIISPPTEAAAEPEQAEPAPLPPKAPEAAVIPDPTQEQAEEAQAVPMPETTQAEAADPIPEVTALPSPPSPKSARVERKPLPRSSNIQDHPAFRKQSMDQHRSLPQQQPQTQQQVNPAVLAAQKALESNQENTSPESQKSHKLSKKQPTGNASGFKKMFGRNKDKSNRRSMEVHNQATLSPPSESSFTRRLSLMRKKSGPPGSAKASQTALQQQPATAAPAATEEPIMPSSPALYNGSVNNMSRVDTTENENAQKEFSRFDQGPMDDMPAAAPQDSVDDEEGDVPDSPTRQYNTQAAAALDPRNEQETPNEGFITPAEQTAGATDDAVSEMSVEPPRAPSPEKDRWAQIRENAQRRAARASEEQSMQSRPTQSGMTEDDGATSEEESKSPHSPVFMSTY